MNYRQKQCQIDRELYCARLALDEVKHKTQMEELSNEGKEEELEELSKEKSDISLKLESFERASEMTESLNKDLDLLKTDIRSEEQSLEAIQADVSNKRTDLDRIEEELMAKQKEQQYLSELESKIPQLKEENETLKIKHEELERTLQEEKERRVQLEDDNQRLLKELEHLRSTSQLSSDDLNKEQHDCDQQKDKLLSKIIEVNPDLKDKNLDDIIQTITLYSETKAKLELATLEIQESKDKDIQLIKQIRQLELECGEKEKSLAQSEQTKKTLMYQVDHFKQKIEDLERSRLEDEDNYRISATSEELLNYKEEQLKTLMKTKENLQQRIQDLNDDIYRWSMKHHEATTQCYANWMAWKQANENLEYHKAEAARLRQMLTQSVKTPNYEYDFYSGRGSSSSIIDSLPPPPPARPPTPPFH